MTILSIIGFSIMMMFIAGVACLKLYIDLSKNNTRVYAY